MATGLEKQAPFASVEEAIEDIRAGRFVVVVDAADRENEGDLTIAAQFATPEAINFMATHGRGLVCLCLTEDAFEVALVRHTLEATTLGSLEPGDVVNLEVDVLAKYVERLAGR